MRVEVGNRIRIHSPSPELIAWCKKHLVITNPEYIKKSRMGFWTGGTPKIINLMEWDEDVLVLPYGCLNVVDSFADPYFDYWTRCFGTPSCVDYNCHVPLYDYQQEAVEAMSKVYCGILQSPAGSGKTQMGIALAAKLGLKTLWLTHTLDLAKQSRDRAEMYMSPNLTGNISGGKVQIGKGITFATVQTMCKLNLNLYRDTWDVIIVDECHHAVASSAAVRMFSAVLDSLAARYKYGLSATVHRADGLITATHALLGPIVHKVPDSAVTDKVVKVAVQSRTTGQGLSREFMDTDGTIIYSKMINFLVDRNDRNELIAKDLVENANHYNLILSDRVHHLKYLMNHLPRDLRENAVMVDGSKRSKDDLAERQKAIEDVRAGRKRYLFATYALAREGLDIPRLDRLYLATPQQDFAVITQSIGRIARTFDGKGEPVCYDYIDDGIGTLVKAYKRRCSTYRKLGCKLL